MLTPEQETEVIRAVARRWITKETICRERNGGKRACPECAWHGLVAHAVLSVVDR